MKKHLLSAATAFIVLGAFSSQSDAMRMYEEEFTVFDSNDQPVGTYEYPCFGPPRSTGVIEGEWVSGFKARCGEDPPEGGGTTPVTCTVVVGPNESTIDAIARCFGWGV